MSYIDIVLWGVSCIIALAIGFYVGCHIGGEEKLRPLRARRVRLKVVEIRHDEVQVHLSGGYKDFTMKVGDFMIIPVLDAAEIEEAKCEA